MSMKYDVFISYRRDGCLDLARSICYYLRSKGVRCFFDLKEIKDGKFDEKIYDAIERTKYFLLLLTDGSLDKCTNPEDWVRLEIEHAIAVKDNRHQIVPLVVDGKGFCFPAGLPESLLELQTIQQSILDSGQHFERDIDDLLINRMPRVGKKISRKLEGQARRREIEAEHAFCERARGYKEDEKKRIDIGGGYQKLMFFAEELRIDRQRANILIQEVNGTINRRRKRVAWMRAHPVLTTLAILAATAVLAMVVYYVLPTEARQLLDESFIRPAMIKCTQLWGKLCEFCK